MICVSINVDLCINQRINQRITKLTGDLLTLDMLSSPALPLSEHSSTRRVLPHYHTKSFFLLPSCRLRCRIRAIIAGETWKAILLGRLPLSSGGLGCALDELESDGHVGTAQRLAGSLATL